MTIEGRPELIGTEKFLNETYAKQRQSRMQDAIDDYLQDDKVSSSLAGNMVCCFDTDSMA